MINTGCGPHSNDRGPPHNERLANVPELPGAPLPPPRDPHGPYRVCCVCLGNICRSPMAEAVLRDQVEKAGLADRVIVDSAGTGDWHVGDAMNARARKEVARNGYDGESHRARQFHPSWLPDRDLILAMDAANLRDLRALAAPEDQSRIRLFGEIAGLNGQDVPDPYYGSADDFARVLALLEAGMSRLVPQLRDVAAVNLGPGSTVTAPALRGRPGVKWPQAIPVLVEEVVVGLGAVDGQGVGREGQLDLEVGALSRRRAHRDRAAVRGHEPGHDRQPESRPA
jgi:protein-tyrosine phosphatase